VAALPADATLAVQGITQLVVPNPAFYRIDTNLLTPRVDASTWSLSVDGMVDHPFSITYDELLAMENVVLTPHLGSATLATREAMGLLAVQALRSVLLDGVRPANAV